ncbi:unnamed protein product [Urochloa humidicola]
MPPAARPLPDDLIPDILVRLAPDDPAGVVRAAAVCKSWRRVPADPTFAGRYRALHPAAPVLGFLHNQRSSTCVPLRPHLVLPPVPRRRPPPPPRARLPPWPRPLLRLRPPPPHPGVPRLGPDRRRPPQLPAEHRRLDAAGRALRRCRGGMQPPRLRRGGHSSSPPSPWGSTGTTKPWGNPRWRWLPSTWALVGDSLYFVGESGILLRYRIGLLRRRLRG